MSTNELEVVHGDPENVTISFVERLVDRRRIATLYAEAMELIDDSAGYLDGIGRKEARRLKSPVSMAYTTESMRLTARLMQLSSWLLIAKGVVAGATSMQQARVQRARISLEVISRPSHVPHFSDLPECLQDLVWQSLDLRDRVAVIDHLLFADPEPNKRPKVNPVDAQLKGLELAFSTTRQN